MTQSIPHLQNMGPLIKGKLIILLGYYIPSILKQEEYIKNCLEFILTCFIKSGEEQTLCYLAQESMQNLMKKKEMRDIIINLMDDFVTTIVNFATQVSSSPFFEFVGDFIISYKKNIGP